MIGGFSCVSSLMVPLMTHSWFRSQPQLRVHLVRCTRLDQVVQIVGLTVVAFEMRVALAVVIVDGAGFVILVGDHEQDDWILGVFAGFNCVIEKIASVDAAIHSNYFHPGSDAGFERKATDDGIHY